MIDRVETAPDHLVSSNAFEIKISNSRWGLRLGGGELASNLCRNIYFSFFSASSEFVMNGKGSSSLPLGNEASARRIDDRRLQIACATTSLRDCSWRRSIIHGEKICFWNGIDTFGRSRGEPSVTTLVYDRGQRAAAAASRRKRRKLATQLLSSIKDATRRASPPKTRVDISVDATTSNDIINEQRQVLNLLLFSESINFQSLIPSTVLHSEKEGRAARDWQMWRGLGLYNPLTSAAYMLFSSFVPPLVSFFGKLGKRKRKKDF